MWQAAEYVARGGVDYAQKLLVKSLGPEMAKRLVDRLVKSFESTIVFTTLEKANPQQLSKFILAEHPQTIALILAHLNPARRRSWSRLLPDDVRVDVLTRMASLDEISPEVITPHLDGHRAAAEVARRRRPANSIGGVRAVAELFNRLDRSLSAPVLEAIEGEAPDLAVSIRNLMFVFDDLRERRRHRRSARSSSAPTRRC